VRTGYWRGNGRDRRVSLCCSEWFHLPFVAPAGGRPG
jgi:hypothetical protein